MIKKNDNKDGTLHWETLSKIEDEFCGCKFGNFVRNILSSYQANLIKHCIR